MKFVHADDLKPGMRLAKRIYNKNGVLLYDRDVKLTDYVINNVTNFGLIGLYILEPAEPLPPLTEEDIEFEQYQTIYMFQLRECIDMLRKGKKPPIFLNLVSDIISRYGQLDHKIQFAQSLRSADDFIYKHSINTSILAAMISNAMKLTKEEQLSVVAAALLYDIGYLYVSKSILEKGNALSQEDKDMIQMNLEHGFSDLKINFQRDDFPARSMMLTEYFIFRHSTSKPMNTSNERVTLMADILTVADAYDQMTAMNVHQTPLSEIMAMHALLDNPDLYSLSVINALADCIHIVPVGASVDLSNHTKGIVLVENPGNFMRPLVLCISNNQLYDLSNDNIYRHMQIVDIMKTMDNRIHIDDSAVKMFAGDDRMKGTVNKFKSSQQKATQRSAVTSPATPSSAPAPAASAPVELPKDLNDLVEAEAVSTATNLGGSLLDNASEESVAPKKKPAKKKKLL